MTLEEFFPINISINSNKFSSFLQSIDIMKENVKDNLYFVDKILGLVQTKQGLKAIVKWENYSYRQTTRELVEQLKLNPSLAPELEALETKFKIKNQIKLIDFETSKQLSKLQSSLYPHASFSLPKGAKDLSGSFSKQVSGESRPSSKKKKRSQSLTLGQIALCKVEAEQKLKKRMDYGLGCTTPDDYFKLLELKNDAWEETKKYKPRKSAFYELVVNEVKGFYHHEDGYRFCIVLEGGEVRTCSQKQMLENLPIHLFNFLTKFLKYMKQAMKEDIEKEQNIIRKKNLKMKSIDAVTKTLNLSEKIASKKFGIHFGNDMEEIENNIKVKTDFLRGKNPSIKDKNDRSDSTGKKSYNFQKGMGQLYKEIMSDLKKDKRSSSSKNPQTPEKETIQRRVTRRETEAMNARTSQSQRRSSTFSPQVKGERVDSSSKSKEKSQEKNKNKSKDKNKDKIKQESQEKKRKPVDTSTERKRKRMQSEQDDEGDKVKKEPSQPRRSSRIANKDPQKKFRYNEVKYEN